jgi:hypothetical protein
VTHFEVARASCPCEVMAKMAMPPQYEALPKGREAPYVYPETRPLLIGDAVEQFVILFRRSRGFPGRPPARVARRFAR